VSAPAWLPRALRRPLRGGTASSRRRCKRGEHEGATGEARFKDSGRGSHRSDSLSTGWRKVAFSGDVLGWQRRAVADSDPGALLRLREGKETVRHGGNEEEDGRRCHSPIEEDSGEGGSKSTVPGGGFQRRGGQTVMPHRGEGGDVVLFGRCHAVKGKSKRGVSQPRCGSREKKRERKRGPAWASHAETKRRGCGTRDMQDTGRGRGGGSAIWSRKLEAGEAWGADGWAWGIQ
jgi:hypothetical protein